MVAEIWASVISSFVDQLVALNQIHNIVHGKAPIYLKSTFSLNTSRHNTRSGPLSLSIPSVKGLGKAKLHF